MMSSRSGLLAALLAVSAAACSPSGDGGSGAAGTGTAGTGAAGTGAAGTGSAGTSGAAGVSAPTDGGADGGGADAPGGCTPALPASLFCAPLGAMPASIKGTGLFPAAPDLTKHPAEMLAYAPDPALWSDGLEKQRFLILPTGKKIDNTNRKQWAFPEGTIFVKTFFDDGGPGGAARPVETRLIRAGKASPYEFFVYQWNAGATDATLVVNDVEGDINAEVPVTVTVKRTVGGQPFMVNGGQPFQHVLPSRDACGKCHETNAMVAQAFIGFDELRLNTKLTAAAPKTQLQAFADAGIFTAPLPASPATITDASNDGGRLLRIKRFVFGNCVSCHNGEGQVDLHPEVFVANTVGKPTEAQSVMPPAGWLRVVPGAPAKSVLYVQMQRTMLPMGGTTRLRAMPPIGVADVAADQAALKDVLDWITALPP